LIDRGRRLPFGHRPPDRRETPEPKETDMAESTDRERIEKLEREVIKFTARLNMLEGKKDWRAVVGMFKGDDAMKEIDEAGRKIREAEREEAKREGEREDAEAARTALQKTKRKKKVVKK
jgi:hypothetical protein